MNEIISPPSLLRQLVRTKPIEVSTGSGDRPLARSLTLFQLTMLGVGCTIGTGIFVILGDAVPKAGPGVVMSFGLAGITAALTVDPRTQTPINNTIVVGVILAVTAAIFPLDVLADLTSLGTLVAFMVVSVGVIILRKSVPNCRAADFASRSIPSPRC